MIQTFLFVIEDRLPETIQTLASLGPNAQMRNERMSNRATVAVDSNSSYMYLRKVENGKTEESLL